MSDPDKYDLKSQLDRYLRGELDPRDVEELKQIVNNDPALREAWVEYQISRYVDGELNKEEIAELRERIYQDPALREALDEYEALEKQLAKLAEDLPEFDFSRQRKEILDSLDRRRYPPPA